MTGSKGPGSGSEEGGGVTGMQGDLDTCADINWPLLGRERGWQCKL